MACRGGERREERGERGGVWRRGGEEKINPRQQTNSTNQVSGLLLVAVEWCGADGDGNTERWGYGDGGEWG